MRGSDGLDNEFAGELNLPYPGNLSSPSLQHYFYFLRLAIPECSEEDERDLRTLIKSPRLEEEIFLDKSCKGMHDSLFVWMFV